MEFAEKPYFMTNEEWYYYDEEEGILKLTDKATSEAINSYKKFYKSLNESYYIE